MGEMIERRKALNELVASYRRAGVSRRDFMKRAAALGLSAPMAAGLLAAAGPRFAAAQDTPQTGGRLTEGYDRDFTKMDTVEGGWADPGFNALYEYIMIRDPQGAFVPQLAESWTIAEDGLTWTFKIRDGLKFHSGTPCDAAAVVANFEAFRGPTGQNAVFWQTVTGVSAGEGNTVVVTTSQPFAAFPETLATEKAEIQNMATKASVGDQYGAAEVDGTGPFTLAEFSPGSQVRVTRWEEYPGSIVPHFQNKGKAYLDEVVWFPIIESANRANEIEAGGVDAITNPAGQDVDRLIANPDLVVMEWPLPANDFISLNHQNTALGFDDVRVRQAISHAIDRQALVDAIYFGHAAATYGPIPPNWRWYEPGVEQFNQFDPGRAAALLDEAGFSPGSGGVRERNGQSLSWTHVNWGGQPNGAQILEAISGMLSEVGVDMKVETLLDAEFFPRISSTDAPPDSFGYEWLWSAPLDVILLFAVYPTPEFNGASPDLAAAFAEYQSAASEEQLEAAARKAQLIWAEQLPKIPVLTPNALWVHHKKVHGWMPTQTMLYPFYNDVWVEQ